jgi:hypothetical protein
LKKNKKEKIVKGFKVYNIIMTQIWQFVATMACGVLAGYLIHSKRPEDKNGMLYCIIGFFLIGTFNFFLGIIQASKRYAREEESKKRINQPKEQDFNEMADQELEKDSIETFDDKISENQQEEQSKKDNHENL